MTSPKLLTTPNSHAKTMPIDMNNHSHRQPTNDVNKQMNFSAKLFFVVPGRGVLHCC